MRQLYLILLFIFLLFTFGSNAQTRTTRREYIETYKELAIREMHRSGIPASITLAQACLESDNGNSKLAVEANNHFGIKCKSDWKGPRSFHDDDRLNECFRKYQTVEESFDDHTLFLMQGPRYAFLFKISPEDFDAWAKGLRSAGYATDPEYANRLIKIITDEQLHQYDLVKPEDLPQRDMLAEKEKRFNPEEVTKNTIKSFGEIYLNIDGTSSHREVKKLNGLDVIYVQEGDTYASIAEEFEMKEWQIRHYNDLDKDSPQPRVDDFLYIKLKRYSAEKGKDTHVVRPQESMWSISQQYGIRLTRLYSLNRMKHDQVPVVGDKLNLRKKVSRKAK